MRSVLHKTGGAFTKLHPTLTQRISLEMPTTCKCRIARQHLDAEALTADRLGHREYEPDKQKPDENANPERAPRSVLGPRRTRPEPRLRKSIGGLTKDRVTGLDNLASTIQDLVKRTRVGSRIAILARSEHGTSKPDRREWGIFLGTRGPVLQKGGYPLQKAESPATRESMRQRREWCRYFARRTRRRATASERVHEPQDQPEVLLELAFDMRVVGDLDQALRLR
jgi:hypothetical protein